MIFTTLVKFLLTLLNVAFFLLQGFVSLFSLPFDIVTSMNEMLASFVGIILYLKVLAPYTVSELLNFGFYFFLVVLVYSIVKITVAFVPGYKKSIG